MSPYVPLELAEIALPLGGCALWARRAATRERAAARRAALAARSGRLTARPAPRGPLHSLHQRRLRRSMARAGMPLPPRARVRS